MKVSEIELDGNWKYLWIPNSDAVAMIKTGIDIKRFIKAYGDVDLVYNDKSRQFECEAFRASREEFIAAKIEDCELWGSN